MFGLLGWDVYAIWMSNHVWTHKESCVPSDPINLLFHKIKLQELSDFLTKHGWKLSMSSISDQFIPDYSTAFKKDMQDAQFTFGSIFNRYHIRLWSRGDMIIGGIHRDIFVLHKAHISADFESAEKYFAELCKKNTKWAVNEDALDLGNSFGGYGKPYNNGKATDIVGT